jgi:hypothetical protein
VREYLEAQRRYRELDAAAVDILQREVDEGWARLLKNSGSEPGKTEPGRFGL